MTKNKGFTLIELLVVIAIVAVLAVVVILTLSPMELIKQARDSTRISDLSTLRSAMAMYLADQAHLADIKPSATVCYMAGTATTSRCGAAFATNYSNPTSSTSTRVDGTGWLPVNFASITSGSPLGSLPLDPVNNVAQGYFYAYAATNTASGFKIVANALESRKYGNIGGVMDAQNNVTNKDGGYSSSSYEVGTNLNL